MFKNECEILRRVCHFWYTSSVKFLPKLSSNNSRKNEKNTTLSYLAHASIVLSVLHLLLLVLVPYFTTCRAPFVQIRKQAVMKS